MCFRKIATCRSVLSLDSVSRLSVLFGIARLSVLSVLFGIAHRVVSSRNCDRPISTHDSLMIAFRTVDLFGVLSVSVHRSKAAMGIRVLMSNCKPFPEQRVCRGTFPLGCQLGACCEGLATGSSVRISLSEVISEQLFSSVHFQSKICSLDQSFPVQFACSGRFR